MSSHKKYSESSSDDNLVVLDRFKIGTSFRPVDLDKPDEASYVLMPANISIVSGRMTCVLDLPKGRSPIFTCESEDLLVSPGLLQKEKDRATGFVLIKLISFSRHKGLYLLRVPGQIVDGERSILLYEHEYESYPKADGLVVMAAVVGSSEA
ncbi:MAG: hypothetical protein EOP06_01930 [Proteobacteria bacterium]|nr:MAG: hypothetical protein EOP06_01930 [Pseudomonadota bacterium]